MFETPVFPGYVELFGIRFTFHGRSVSVVRKHRHFKRFLFLLTSVHSCKNAM